MNKLFKLLSWLTLWLTLGLSIGVDDNEPPPDDGNQEPNPDDTIDDNEPPQARGRGDARITSLVDSNKRLEEALKAEREARLALEARMADPKGPQQSSIERQQWEEEQRVLDDPYADANLKYSVQVSREQRKNAALMHQMQVDLADVNDKTNVEALYRQHSTKITQRHKDEVEKLFQAERSKGNFISRATLLPYVLGMTFLSAADKPAKAPKPKTQPSTPPSAGANGSRGNSSLSEAEARRKRLEGVII